MVVQIWQFNFQFCQFLPSQNLYQWRSAGVSCLIEVLLIIIFSYPYKKPPIKAKIAKVKFNGAKPLSFILGHFNLYPTCPFSWSWEAYPRCKAFFKTAITISSGPFLSLLRHANLKLVLNSFLPLYNLRFLHTQIRALKTMFSW